MSHSKNNHNLASENLKKKKNITAPEVNNNSEKTYTSLKNNIDQLNSVDGSGIKNLEEKYWLNWKPKHQPLSHKKLKNTANDNLNTTGTKNKSDIKLINDFPQICVSKSVNCIILPKRQDVSLQTEEIKLSPTPLRLNKKTSTSLIKIADRNSNNELSSVVHNIFKANPNSIDVTRFQIDKQGVIQNKNNHNTNVTESVTRSMRNNVLHTNIEKKKYLEKNSSSITIQNQWKGGSYPLKSCSKTCKNISNFKRATSNSSISKIKFVTKSKKNIH